MEEAANLLLRRGHPRNHARAARTTRLIGGVMNRARVLIVDLVQAPCSILPCRRLPDLLQDVLPTGAVTRHTSLSALEKATVPRPQLIVFRPDRATAISGTLRTWRRRWAGVAIIGLFCDQRRSSHELLESLMNGMDDFLSCPFEERELAARVGRLLRGPAGPSQEGAGACRVGPLVGQSERFVQMLRKLPLLARSDGTVLITGETGTGKDLVARAIHYQSQRLGKPFIPVNCGALPDHLCENELFGHVRGAYTDASSAERGLVAEAEGGTLFLDEIDTLSLSAQAKLLRFLQDREYRPLGSPRGLVADVRILAATNRDLRRRVEDRQFREDLYYRLNVLPLEVPPLRERLEDLPLLVECFLSRYQPADGRERVTLSAAALRKLMAYAWPGNVRELEGIVQRALVLRGAAVLEPEDLDLPGAESAEAGGPPSFRDAKSRTIGQFERAYLVNLLRSHRGNVSQAARAAGKERRTFQRLLRKHGLEPRAFANPS